MLKKIIKGKKHKKQREKNRQAGLRKATTQPNKKKEEEPPNVKNPLVFNLRFSLLILMIYA